MQLPTAYRMESSQLKRNPPGPEWHLLSLLCPRCTKLFRGGRLNSSLEKLSLNFRATDEKKIRVINLHKPSCGNLLNAPRGVRLRENYRIPERTAAAEPAVVHKERRGVNNELFHGTHSPTEIKSCYSARTEII